MLNAQSGLNRGFDEFDDEFGQPAGESAFLAEHQRRAAEVERSAGAWIETGRARQGARSSRGFTSTTRIRRTTRRRPTRPGTRRRPYDGEVAYTDAVLGRLLARLDPPRASRPTLVVVTSDHGEGLGDHGEAEHGFFLYETTLRVPADRPAARDAAGRRCASPPRRGSIDVLPTILDLAGRGAATPAGLPAGRCCPPCRWSRSPIDGDRACSTARTRRRSSPASTSTAPSSGRSASAAGSTSRRRDRSCTTCGPIPASG